jgi:TonB family protein
VPANLDQPEVEDTGTETSDLFPPAGDGGPPAAKKKVKAKKTFAESESAGEAPVSLDTDSEGDIPLSHLIDTPAEIIAQGKLEFPEEFKNQEIETSSTIDIYLDNLGEIRNLQIVRSGERAFDEAAIRMILETTFSPAYSGELPVPCIVRMEVVFNTIVEGAQTE